MQKKVRFINCLKTIEYKVLYEPNRPSAILSATKLGRNSVFVYESAENVFLIIFQMTEYKRTKLPGLCLAFGKGQLWIATGNTYNSCVIFSIIKMLEVCCFSAFICHINFVTL